MGAFLVALFAPAYAQSDISLPAAPIPSADRASVSLDSHPSLDTVKVSREAPPPPQTSRILGIIPNFRSVRASTILPPQTAREKFGEGLEDSFDYSSFVFAGLEAGLGQATNSYPQFRQGAPGFARYYWHTIADQTDENFMVESIVPIVLHQDSRYYTLGYGGFFKRTGYALSRALVTRNDDGRETFNASEIVGTGAAAGISSTYYPGQYSTWTKTGQRWLTNVVLDSSTFVVEEFWPSIHRIISRGRDSAAP